MEHVRVLQDAGKAMDVMLDAAVWMEKIGLPYSPWWDPQHMNADYLFRHAEPDEFYVAVTDGKPAASVILQETERNQSWKPVDGDHPQKALYVHWLCVAREFAGQGYSKLMIDFAAGEAGKRGLKLLRLDTNAEEQKLRKLYEGLGFQLMGTEPEKDHITAFYQKPVRPE